MNPLAYLAALFSPQPTLADDQVERGLRMMTAEGIASMAMFSVTTSGILAAFALALGANNLQIGILAAIPFITQPLQIPAIILVEKLRRRKLIGVLSWFPAQLMWVFIALIPFFIGVPSPAAVAVLLGLLAIRGCLGAFTNCAWNSWVRDLVPQRILGSYFSRRMALATTGAIVFGLAGAFFADWWQGRASPENQILGYSFVLLFGAVFLGLASPVFMSQMPEPAMSPVSGPQLSLLQMLKTPFRDRNFRQLLNFLFFWSFAANLALPFFTVYMLQRLGFPLFAVIGLNTLAQITNVMFVGVWGQFADKFSSKVALSLSASLYLLVILGWVFTTMPERYALTMPLVVVLQIFAGVAAAGVNLTVGTIGLKLAPQGESTPYMATASLATNLGAGLGPLAGGLFADFFSVRQLGVTLEWVTPGKAMAFSAIHLTGFDFLFALAFVIGVITLNTLTTIREEGEVSRDVALAELLAPTRDMTRAIGSVPGLRVLSEFPYSYLRRVPGVDVALGVTAYQVAASARAAATAASQGGAAATDIAARVNRAVTELVNGAGDLREASVGLARQTARGAMNAAGDAGSLAEGAALGALRALRGAGADLRGLARAELYGTVEGAVEAGADAQEATRQALAGAREAFREMGVAEEEGLAHAAQGALDAARATGSADVVAQIKAALAEEGITDLESLPADPSEHDKWA